MVRGDAKSAQTAAFLAAAFLGSAAYVLASEPAAISFREVARDRGLEFQFFNGTRGRHDLPEIMGGGVALIDVDGDSWLDVYFCNGGPIEPRAGQADPPCRLYRNQGNGTFTEITRTANVPGPNYAMGAAVGDYDGDGRDDLFVTGWRDQRLYRNLGGGRFEDVTARARVSSNLWSTSAAFADLDGDGDLDLYVANYLDFDPANAPYCVDPDGRRDYCEPEDFAAQPDRLYRNNGDGTFTDVAPQTQIDQPSGRGLGVLIADLTGDRRPDIFVANDGSACWLYENQGGLRFREVGLEAGVAVDVQGRSLSGMGIAFGDIDGDARSDLVVTNFYGRATVAFRAQRDGTFVDDSAALGLIGPTRDVVGFGVTLEDFDGDGRLDLLQANGHVLDRARLGIPFAMRTTLLHNDHGRFTDISARGAAWLSRPVIGRGVAVGDLDGDCRPDVVVNALDSPAALLHNSTEGARFLTLELLGRGAPTPVGARVRLPVDGRITVRQVTVGGSYLSASGRRLYVGLGRASSAERLEVWWPSGRVESWKDLKAGEVHRLVEGKGTAQR